MHSLRKALQLGTMHSLRKFGNNTAAEPLCRQANASIAPASADLSLVGVRCDGGLTALGGEASGPGQLLVLLQGSRDQLEETLSFLPAFLQG